MRRALQLLGIVLVLASAPVVAIGTVMYVRTSRFVDRAVEAQGRVVALRGHRDDDGRARGGPTIAFTDGSGQSHEIQPPTGTTRSTYKVGDTVAVLYVEGKAEEARLNSTVVLWWTPAVLCSLGSGAMLLGLASLFLGFRMSRTLAKALRVGGSGP